MMKRLTLAEAVQEIEQLPDGYFGGTPATLVEKDAVLAILARTRLEDHDYMHTLNWALEEASHANDEVDLEELPYPNKKAN